jgi:sugar phosphate isomerase/epimerase
MKKISLIALSIFALSLSEVRADESSQVDYPLGVFHFDFPRLGADEASQIRELKSIGYGGMVLRMGVGNEKQAKASLKTLHQYQATAGDGSFDVYAAYVGFTFNTTAAQQKAQHAHIDNVVRSLKKSNAKLWVILNTPKHQAAKSEVKPEEIEKFLRSVAERTKKAGVELVVYPHDNTVIETAEEALPSIKKAQNGNIFLSLHLCHEVRAGNGERLDEIAAKIGPLLRLPSINGADVATVNEVKGWDLGIQPLTKGDYDSSKLLKALKSVGYKGPVILHTWGLQDEAADHHHTSFKRFQEMVDALDED